MALLEPHDDEHENPAGAKGGKGSKQHRDNLLIIAGTLGVLIFTYLIWRGSGSSKPQPTSGGGTGGQVASGAGGSAYNDQYLQQIYQQMADTLTQNQQSQSDALAGFQQYLQMLADQIGNQTPASPTTPAGPTPTITPGPGWDGGAKLREWALEHEGRQSYPVEPIVWGGWDSGLPTAGPGGIGPQSPDDVLDSGHWSGSTLVGGWYKRPDGSLYSVGN